MNTNAYKMGICAPYACLALSFHSSQTWPSFLLFLFFSPLSLSLVAQHTGWPSSRPRTGWTTSWPFSAAPGASSPSWTPHTLSLCTGVCVRGPLLLLDLSFLSFNAPHVFIPSISEPSIYAHLPSLSSALLKSLLHWNCVRYCCICLLYRRGVDEARAH